MQRWREWRGPKSVLFAALVAVIGTPAVFAVNPSSSHYELSESSFNAGEMDACGSQFCARASIGEVATGETRGATSTARFGAITPEEPALEVIVDPGVSDLGTLTTEHTASKTMVVRIRNYLSNGYTLQITGDPPKYSSHFLATPSTPTPSTPGTEQFAINAAVNTTPAVGAAPVQVPSGEFAYGYVMGDYATANVFKYSSGDVVARSDSESGRTDYTISMIINVSNRTPAGHYTGNYSAVVIPVF